jgi:hypothetical protein
MNSTSNLVRQELYHNKYHLDGRENLDEIPPAQAVFGVFGIVDEEPANCRYVGEAENLQAAIRGLYDNPPSAGMKKFLQGPWIPMLVFEPLPGASAAQREKAAGEWQSQYHPQIDEDGEYPGYYDS